MPDRFVTVKQLVADYCPVSEDLVRYWIRHSELPVHRGSKTLDPGKGVIMIQVSEFFEWMKQRRELRQAVMNSASVEAKELFNKVMA